jgi:hypothetical protein
VRILLTSGDWQRINHLPHVISLLRVGKSEFFAGPLACIRSVFAWGISKWIWGFRARERLFESLSFARKSIIGIRQDLCFVIKRVRERAVSNWNASSIWKIRLVVWARMD